MTNGRLPNELSMEILSQLPIKDLVRFRCVCKPWLRLLTGNVPDHYFTELHAHRSAITNPNPVMNRLLSKDEEDNDFYRFYFAPDYNQFRELKEIELPPPLSFITDNHVRVAGICNGLVCLEIDDGHNICIWNPLTRDHFMIPCLPFPSHFYTGHHFALFGFGFNEAAYEYKVIRVVNSYKDMHCFSVDDFQTHISVYTLGTNTWRTLQNVPFSIDPHNGGVQVDGALHWHASQPGFGCYIPEKIISFHLEREVFEEIKEPGDLDFHYLDSMGIAELSGSLSVSRDGYENVDIWVMNEYGVEDSWTKQFTFFSLDKAVPGLPLVLLMMELL